MTPAITELRTLLERVEGATGNDFELFAIEHELAKLMPGFDPAAAKRDIPAYLRSIDAAVAFSQAVLPGWLIIEMGQDPLHGLLHGLWFCCLYNIDTKSAAESSELDRPALAIIAATLRAKIAEMETSNAE